MAISDWRALPFEELWAVDTEYYPGAGLANGGKAGDATTPLCLVALEMRTGRTIRLWQDEFGPFPPYRLDAGALIMGYMISAEFGSHIALGWGRPACALDPYIEFRHHVNDGAAKAADREKGFYGLDGALRYFHENGIDTAHKTEMRDRILQGPPFSADARVAILNYCEEDVRALAQLIKHIVPTIRSLPHAMMRAHFQWAIAQQERRGVPLDAPRLDRIRSLWSAIRSALVIEMDARYGIYEFVDGEPHWRKQRFADYVHSHHMTWPTYDDGALDEREQTFREMAGRYPQIENLRDAIRSQSYGSTISASATTGATALSWEPTGPKPDATRRAIRSSYSDRRNGFGSSSHRHRGGRSFIATTASRRSALPRCCPATPPSCKPANPAMSTSASLKNSASSERT